MYLSLTNWIILPFINCLFFLNAQHTMLKWRVKLKCWCLNCPSILEWPRKHDIKYRWLKMRKTCTSIKLIKMKSSVWHGVTPVFLLQCCGSGGDYSVFTTVLWVWRRLQWHWLPSLSGNVRSSEGTDIESGNSWRERPVRLANMFIWHTVTGLARETLQQWKRMAPTKIMRSRHGVRFDQ